MERTARTSRTTGETRVSASVNLDGTGAMDVSTGNRFVNHLVVSLARHSMIDITLHAESLDGMLHHLVEDSAITLGTTLRDALGERTGIVRFGHAAIPMDDSLADCSVDLVRRPYRMVDLSLDKNSIEDVPREDVEHFFGSLLSSMEACVHIRILYGINDHHKAEAAIKALAVSLREAISLDTRRTGAPSTKGTM